MLDDDLMAQIYKEMEKEYKRGRAQAIDDCIKALPECNNCFELEKYKTKLEAMK